jgi:hypothetical protein
LAARARDQASPKDKPGLAAGKRLAVGETALDKNRSFTDADQIVILTTPTARPSSTVMSDRQ